MFKRFGLLVLALTLAGCGAKHLGTAAAVDTGETVVQIKSAASSFDEQKFWTDFPTQVAWVTIKSQKLDYMVVQLSARQLGFNQGAKLFFPVTVQGQVQFSSNLFMGKDKGIYVSQLGDGSADYRFYKVGSFGVRTLDFTEGDAIKLRFDPGFTFNAQVVDGKGGAAPTLNASLELKAMPTTVSHAILYTRPTGG